MNGKNGPVEPAADLRELASALRQTYVALVQEGFTTPEALSIIGQILVAKQARGMSALIARIRRLWWTALPPHGCLRLVHCGTGRD